MRPSVASLVLIVSACSPSVPPAANATAISAAPGSSATPPPISSAPPASATPPAATAGEAPLATLVRTACYGFCPVYQLTVRANGTVVYEGESFVKVKGKAFGQLDEAGLTRLKQAFAAAKFGSLASTYETVSRTDAPSAVVSFADGTQAKTVRHYHGDMAAPPELSKLEEEIDTIVHVEQWIGTEDERRKNSDVYAR